MLGKSMLLLSTLVVTVATAGPTPLANCLQDQLALVQRQASRLQRGGEPEQVDAEDIAAAELTAAHAGEQVSQDSLPLPLLSARGNVGSMSYVGILYIFFWSLGAITPWLKLAFGVPCLVLRKDP
jgi:hypothetical protein